MTAVGAAAVLMHGLGLVVLWRYRRTDHPWLLPVYGASCLSVAARFCLASPAAGGLQLLGSLASPAGSPLAQALFYEATLAPALVALLAAVRLSGDRVPGWFWYALPLAMVLVGGVPLGARWSRLPRRLDGVVVACLLLGLGGALARRIARYARSCLERRISIDLLHLALLLACAQILLRSAALLAPGPLIHHGFDALFSWMSVVAFLGYYGWTKRPGRAPTRA